MHVANQQETINRMAHRMQEMAAELIKKDKEKEALMGKIFVLSSENASLERQLNELKLKHK